jgi:hypothetical protein
MQPAGQRSRLRKIAHAALYPVLQPRFARYSRRWSASCPWLWALDGARASISELPRRYDNDRQDAKAVAEPAVHARPTDHAMTSLWHRFCVTTGRPAASNDETEVHCVSCSPAAQLSRAVRVSVCARAPKRSCVESAHDRTLLMRWRAPRPSWAVRSRPTSGRKILWRRISVRYSNRRNGKAFGQGKVYFR